MLANVPRSAPSLSSAALALGIALLSMATLMFELVVSKALSFSTWGSLGYMIIGSAIFGFSVAGVALALWRPDRRRPIPRLLAGAALCFSFAVVLAYLVMNLVPFNFEQVFARPLTQAACFTAWYLALLAPFAAAGFAVALLLTFAGARANRFYAADLAGAGLGCLLVVPLFPLVGAAGQYLVCAALGALAACAFAWPRRGAVAASAGLAATFLLAAPAAERVYPVQAHQPKRERWQDVAAGHVTHSLWSFLSKIEVAERPGQPSGMIWFDGGLMQSAIDRFDGDYAAERGSPAVAGANSLPYRLRPCRHALVIGPAGGREVRSALVWGAGRVTGVELDSSVVRLVRRDLANYLGGLFGDPRVRLVNDEGRSFVRRSAERYDVIQLVSAYSVAAIHSGALDLSDSYLLTLEAFGDYLDHLGADGILAISKDWNVRLFFTAWHALERRRLDPHGRLVLLRNDFSTLGRNTLLVSLRPFSRAELASLAGICRERGIGLIHGPPPLQALADAGRLESEPRTRRILAQTLRLGPSPRSYARFPYRVSPATDDRPYFDNVRYLFRDLRSVPGLMTEELAEQVRKAHYLPWVPIGAAANLAVLLEAAVLALLFLVFPLWRLRSGGVRSRRQRLALLYFLALGLGFIWVEIVLLKRFILFLGSPVYSISLVLCSMLVAAGLGSLATERLGGSAGRVLARLGAGLAAAFGTVLLVYPWTLDRLLSLPFPARVFAAALLIAPVGFALGMPFPAGLRHLAEVSPESIPWAWAMNGYGTVVGVASASLITPVTGFRLLLLLAAAVYLGGILCLWRAQRAPRPG